MKKILLFGLILASSQTFAASFEGCFLIYGNGITAKTFCLKNTDQMKGAQLSYHEGFTKKPISCVNSGVVLIEFGDTLEVIVDGKHEMTLQQLAELEPGLTSGKVTIEKTHYYGEFSPETTKAIMDDLDSSGLCK